MTSRVTTSRGLCIADMNGDGRPDVVTPDHEFLVHLNQGGFPDYRNYGGGVSGGRGPAPWLRGEGRIVPGSPLRLSAGGAAPRSMGVLFAGTAEGDGSLLGARLRWLTGSVQAVAALPPGGTQPDGSTTLSLPVPAALWAGGARLYFEAALLDPSAPEGLARTGGLEAWPAAR